MTNKTTIKHYHPKGLPYLFLTEAWERFGYYVVQGLLILYMTQAFGFSDDVGYEILGAFAALAYVTPLAGGYLANKLLGYRETVVLGGILLCLGYAVLAVPGLTLFYLALGLIICGTGLLKPNISSLLGDIYEKNNNPSSRESGFTIFYMGINLGVLLATATSGFVKQRYGWHVSFGLASFSMLIGIAVFLLGREKYGKAGLAPKLKHTVSASKKMFSRKSMAYAGILAAVVLMTVLMQHAEMSNILLLIVVALIFIGLLIYAMQHHGKTRSRMIALILLNIISIVFWAIYLQTFFSSNLFINRLVDRHIFGFEIPAIAFLSLIAIYILLLGVPFAKLWEKLESKNRQITIPTKFALACICAGLTFAVLALSIKMTPSLSINPLWIALAYLFLTIGEMLLSPVGLAMVTMLAPVNLVGLLMGLWFVSIGLGGDLAGMLAKIAGAPDDKTSPQVLAHLYSHAFFIYALLGFVSGLIVFLLTPWLKRLMCRET